MQQQNKKDEFTSALQKQSDIDISKVAQMRKKKQELEEKTSEVGKKIALFTPLVISSIISLTLIIGIEFFSGEWDFSKISDATFWLSFFIFQVAITTLVLAIYTTIAKSKKKTSGQISVNVKKKQELVDLDYVEPFIEEEALYEDTQRKIKAWKSKNKRKIEKWRRKIKFKNDKEQQDTVKQEETDEILSYEAFVNKHDNFIKKRFKLLKKPIRTLIENRKIRKNIKIREKIEYYTYMLSEDFIMKNIESLKVKYNQVSKQSLTSGVSPSCHKSGEEPIKVKRWQILLKKNVTRIATAGFFTAFMGVLILDLNDFDASSWFKLATKITILLYNGWNAILDSEDYFEATDIYESNISTSVLNKLYLRHKNKKKEVKVNE